MIRGAIFSIDSLLAFVILMIAALAFLGTLSNYEQRISSSARDFYLEEKTILAADSFVKNYSPQNTLLGSAVFDLEKKRVKSNELSSLNFASFSELESGSFFVKRVGTKNKVFYESEKEGTDCVGVERFVLLDSIKTIITFVGCLNE